MEAPFGSDKPFVGIEGKGPSTAIEGARASVARSGSLLLGWSIASVADDTAPSAARLLSTLVALPRQSATALAQLKV